MTQKLFAVSVARMTAYDENEQVVLTGKALMDSTFKTSLSKVEVRGSKSNALLFNYYHSGNVDINIINPVFDISYIATAVGSTLVTGANLYTNETVVLTGGGAGTVVGTPIADLSDTKYGWVTLVSGAIERVTFTGQNFTCSGTSGDSVCVQYFATDNAAKIVTVSSRIIPSILRVVLDVDLASNEAASSIVGKIQVIIPKVQFDGIVELNMKADAVSQLPLHGTALSAPAPTGLGCASDDEVYAYIIQVLNDANFYDDLVAIAIQGGDLALTHPDSVTLVVRGIHSDNSVSTIDNANLTFSSSAGAVATVGANTGVVTTVGSGSTYIHATVTAANQFDSTITVTVS